MHQVAKATHSRLDQLDEVARPKQEKPIQMAIPNAEKLKGNTVLTVNGLSVARGDRQLLQDVSLKIKAGDHIAITGPNMAGKTSLLTALINRNDNSVKWSPLAKIGYFQQDLADLVGADSVIDNVAATSIQDAETVRLILARLGSRLRLGGNP
ncbi:ATP-binding cassette domain-containing protein [Secundilactobacillus collinoides]|uniref:ATP-binding cassette domain-containing protein n=1 Tax=Secundilactobacillus collinoides TaxID=33960 RepID=UPI0015854AE0|nr:ATP-binding cassette domain-containing protein [Secundilactobacillus collinoides]